MVAIRITRVISYLIWNGQYSVAHFGHPLDGMLYVGPFGAARQQPAKAPETNFG